MQEKMEIERLEALAEEMTNAPKEEFPYKRQPGEMGTYEKNFKKWQDVENADNRTD